MSRPNVILIMADQHRWDFMGYETNGITYTPHLDQLGRGGTILRSAYCTAPLCCPSRAAIASGRYGMNTGCFTNLHQLPAGTPSFVSQFRDSGYHTSVIGKTHMEIHAYDADFCSDEHLAYMRTLGWEEVFEADGMTKEGVRCQYGNFLERKGAIDDFLAFSEHWHYFMDTERKGDPAFTCHEWTLPEELHLTAFVGNKTVDWLSRYDSDKPFLLQVGFLAPHSPTMPPPEFMDQYRDSDEAPPWNAPNPPPWLAEARRGYRAMITHLDAYVGRIRAYLAERGLLENTIFVYTADHGEMAGDHGQSGKTTFYEASVRVPLLFSGPGVAAGQDSQALVETIDIGRTLCDLCGVEPHAFENGQSLAPLLRGETISHRNAVYSEMGCDRMMRTERYKLMWGEPTFDKRKLGRLHLDKPVDVPPSPGAIFDLDEDPHETRNLIEDRDLRLDLLEHLLARINENTETQPFLSRGEYRPLRSNAERTA